MASDELRRLSAYERYRTSVERARQLGEIGNVQSPFSRVVAGLWSYAPLPYDIPNFLKMVGDQMRSSGENYEPRAALIRRLSAEMSDSVPPPDLFDTIRNPQFQNLLFGAAAGGALGAMRAPAATLPAPRSVPGRGLTASIASRQAYRESGRAIGGAGTRVPLPMTEHYLTDDYIGGVLRRESLPPPRFRPGEIIEIGPLRLMRDDVGRWRPAQQGIPPPTPPPPPPPPPPRLPLTVQQIREKIDNLPPGSADRAYYQDLLERTQAAERRQANRPPAPGPPTPEMAAEMADWELLAEFRKAEYLRNDPAGLAIYRNEIARRAGGPDKMDDWAARLDEAKEAGGGVAEAEPPISQTPPTPMQDLDQAMSGMERRVRDMSDEALENMKDRAFEEMKNYPVGSPQHTAHEQMFRLAMREHWKRQTAKHGAIPAGLYGPNKRLYAQLPRRPEVEQELAEASERARLTRLAHEAKADALRVPIEEGPTGPLPPLKRMSVEPYYPRVAYRDVSDNGLLTRWADARRALQQSKERQWTTNVPLLEETVKNIEFEMKRRGFIPPDVKF